MLTDTAIRKAKPKAKAYKLADGGGLFLLVAPAGGKWWRFKYRRPVTRKENLLTFGTYPETSLAEARAKWEEAKKLLKDGIDPGEQRKAEKLAGAARAANSFEALALEWLAKQSWVPGYLVKVTAWFEKDVFPWIGARPVADLTAPEFLAVVQRVEQRGAIESAHRILQNCGQVMRYACATGRATSNPIPNLRGSLTAAPEKHHAAITDPAAIGALMRAIEGYKGSLVTRCALRLAPLLFVRPGELRNAEWTEIDFAAAEWRIPAEKMKMREPHLVPLCRQAVDILRELHPLTGRGRYVFPSGRGGDRPLSSNAVLAALRRMGYAKDEMTGHGFRAIARTVLDEVLGFRPDFIEHQLAHAVRDANGRAYNRTSYLPQRREMMQAWADYLDSLREAEAGKVVPFKRSA
ncbi:MAG: integrase arm-type DNA-binding domain-containing protein [Pseudomonadota bacterium]|nr:integrase arm-type DNA-binding domain-containing protein [Pseudomonadota bacterium]